MRKNWDIFCRVIDNFGDIGVCWRLARQLVNAHGQNVRLWLDKLGSLASLQHEVSPDTAEQTVAGVIICQWPEDFSAIVPSDVVIEAFACPLPPAYEQAMAQKSVAPLWINLEYLSAERWIEECHGLASPHPVLPLVKYFWFPGFTARSGGLLHESDLVARRDAFFATRQRDQALQVSLFCYDNAPVAALLDAWAQSKRDILCRVAAGKPQAVVRAHLGEAVAGGWRHGRLRLEALPFVPQDDFDALLWRSDLNFVRGEDSFVRAQWAALPLVWQTYPQDDDTHLEKLHAFLDLYCHDLPPAAASALRDFHLHWNSAAPDSSALTQSWLRLEAQLPVLERHAHRWCERLISGEDGQATESTTETATDLASNLVNFAAAKL